MSNFSENLKEAYAESTLKKGDLAKTTGVALSTVTRWFNGESIPRGETLLIVASLLGVNAKWLLGEGAKKPVNLDEVERLKSAKQSSTVITEISEELVEIPVLSWAHAGQAMAYEEMEEGYLEPIAIPKKMLNSYRACGLIVDGDSMEPVIEHGDRIAVLQGAEPRNGCLVVAKFKHDEGVQVRRFVILSAPNGKPDKIKLIPYNNIYPATEHHISEFAWIMPVAAMMRHFW